MNEQKLLNLIQEQVENVPGTEWQLMSKLRLNRQAREIDVVIGMPKYGLLILELKGWRNIGVTNSGQIYKTDNGNRKIVSDPYVQLSAEISAMSELFRNHLNERPTISGAVIYSGISSQALKRLTRDAPNIFPAELSLTIEDITQPASSDHSEDHPLLRVLGKIAIDESSRNRRPHHKNDADTILKALSLLRSEVEVDFLDQQLKEITDAVEQNSQYSINLIQRPLNGLRRIHVTGPAGTGKTVLALSIAHERALTLDKASLYLCFSDNLRNHITERRSKMLSTNVWVETPETLYSRLIGTEFVLTGSEDSRPNPLADLGVIFPSEVNDEDRLYVCEDRIWMEILEQLEIQRINFAAVCVDEGQDFWGPLYQVLDEQTLKDGTFAIFADENQTTRASAAFRQYEQDRPGFHQVQLRTNLRNSPAVARAIKREFSPAIQYEINENIHSGTPPHKYEWETNVELWRLIEKINNEVSKTLTTDIVLLHDSQCPEKTRGMLQRASSLFGWTVCTTDEFRGLESDIVISVDSRRDGVTNAIEALWKQRYVAYSRSRGLLYILQESNHTSQLTTFQQSKVKQNQKKNAIQKD
jgi:hypothetical protein